MSPNSFGKPLTPTTNGTMPTQAINHDPLAQLADIHLPAEVADFPWAPGWWLLLITGIVLLTTLGWWAFRVHRRRAWLRTALAELETIKHLDNDTDFAIALNQLLKRVAILKHGSQSAGLCGQAWLDFLNQHSATDTQQFHLLLDVSYSPSSQLPEREQLLIQTQQWIKAQTKAKNTYGAGHA